MLRFVLGAAATALCLSTLPAQLQKFGGPAARAATSVILFDEGAGAMAGVSIEYGQPMWKAEYDAMAEQVAGQRIRLGKDWWASFDTTTAVELGGVKIPAGSYVLGLVADDEGAFSLAVLDAGKAMKTGAMPWAPDSWEIAYEIPMELEKGALDETQEKLTIALDTPDEKPTELTLSITWGKHRLSATGMIHFGGPMDASMKK